MNFDFTAGAGFLAHDGIGRFVSELPRDAIDAERDAFDAIQRRMRPAPAHVVDVGFVDRPRTVRTRADDTHRLGLVRTRREIVSIAAEQHIGVDALRARRGKRETFGRERRCAQRHFVVAGNSSGFAYAGDAAVGSEPSVV